MSSSSENQYSIDTEIEQKKEEVESDQQQEEENQESVTLVNDQDEITVFTCNQCNYEFKQSDIRFECLVCPEYDLCTSCYELQDDDETEMYREEECDEHETTHEMRECIHNCPSTHNESEEQTSCFIDSSNYSVEKKRRQRISQFLDLYCGEEEGEELNQEVEDDEDDEDEDEEGIPEDLQDFIANDSECEEDVVQAAQAEYRLKHKKRKRIQCLSSDEEDSHDIIEKESEDLQAYTASILKQHKNCNKQWTRLRKIQQNEDMEQQLEEEEEEQKTGREDGQTLLTDIFCKKLNETFAKKTNNNPFTEME